MNYISIILLFWLLASASTSSAKEAYEVRYRAYDEVNNAVLSVESLDGIVDFNYFISVIQTCYEDNVTTVKLSSDGMPHNFRFTRSCYGDLYELEPISATERKVVINYLNSNSKLKLGKFEFKLNGYQQWIKELQKGNDIYKMKARFNQEENLDNDYTRGWVDAENLRSFEFYLDIIKDGQNKLRSELYKAGWNDSEKQFSTNLYNTSWKDAEKQLSSKLYDSGWEDAKKQLSTKLYKSGWEDAEKQLSSKRYKAGWKDSEKYLSNEKYIQGIKKGKAELSSEKYVIVFMLLISISIHFFKYITRKRTPHLDESSQLEHRVMELKNKLNLANNTIKKSNERINKLKADLKNKVDNDEEIVVLQERIKVLSRNIQSLNKENEKLKSDIYHFNNKHENFEVSAYLLLGVNPSNFNFSKAKSNYKKLSQIYHPDKSGSQEMMKKIHDAYGKLRNIT